MRKVEPTLTFKWKYNIEEILNVAGEKPFLKVSRSSYLKERYYLYGGIIDGKLRLFYYPLDSPNAQINFGLISPDKVASGEALIYKGFETYSPSDLIESTSFLKFKMGIPYKIVNKRYKGIVYGFFKEAISPNAYSFYCFCEGKTLEEEHFNDIDYDFYELDEEQL
jgi:hypothetical protein